MEDGFLEYKNSKIYFLKFGNGEKLLIALHGFGDQASVFLPLEPALKKDYTVYALDLPFHGQTQWQGDSFSKKNMIYIFELILKREHKTRFELMGFSFGGRIILSSLLETISKLDKIYLIAPDGVKTRGIFNAMLVPVWLRRFIKKQINHPDWVIKIMEKAYQIGLLTKFNFSFIRHNISTQQRRERIFNTWISLSDFSVNLKKSRNVLKEYSIPVELYFGKLDKIIPLKAGEKLSNGMPNIRLNILEEGHLLLNEKLNDLISDQLKKG
jgi:pimeloyl-ACP methyl ester carboxylesterase